MITTMETIIKQTTLILVIFLSIGLIGCSNNINYEKYYDDHEYVKIYTETSNDSIFVFNDKNRVKILKAEDPTISENVFIIDACNGDLSQFAYEPNLFIRDLFTDTPINNNSYISKQFGLYGVNSFHHPGELILTNGGNFTFIRITKMSYEEVLINIIQYFKDNNIDERLLPIYIDRASKVWLLGKRSFDEFGNWHDWFNYPDKDEIAKEYSAYMDFLH